LIDPDYKSSVLLSKTEADKRKELISEIEYDYQLALNKGDCYLGSAVINFYLESVPAPGELFLDFQAMAISNLTFNDQGLENTRNIFKGQRIKLEAPYVQIGWNTVQMKYFNPYNKNRVGLHTYHDTAD